MKKYIAVFVLFISTIVSAQTNIQVQYDVREKGLIGTVEHYSEDDWGNTFFFIDLASNWAYGEFARNINLWQESKARNLSIQIEYDYKDALLLGVNYFLYYNPTYSTTINLQVLYKGFLGNNRDRKFPFQCTCTWSTLQLDRIQFTGFVDFWYEYGIRIISEPQIWYNISEQFSVGSELSLNLNPYIYSCVSRIGMRYIF